MSFNLSHQPVIAAGALSLLLLSGCSPDDSAEFAETESTEAGAAEEQSTAEAAGTSEDVETAEDSVEPTDEPTDEAGNEDAASAGEAGGVRHADALQSITYPALGTDGEITAGLQGLTIDGETMLLELTFVADYDESAGTMTFNELHGLGDQAGNAHIAPVIHDRQNTKSYHVLSTDSHRLASYRGSTAFGDTIWSTEVNNRELAPGQTLYVWAVYAAPQDDIEAVSVSFDPGAPEFQDVQLQQKDSGDE